MEQRIGSSSQPLEGAGFDPAFIPGLTSPASGREEDAKTKTKADGPEDDATEPEADAGTEAEEEAVEAAEENAASEDGSEAAEEDPEPAPEGPVFEASDRRARIVADHSGVRLRLDDQECEFRWDEIGAVETETPRFGKRYTVTVHTPDRRWYFLEIEAGSRSRFAEWDAELDAVLDEYFDDEADGTADAGDDSDTAADDSEDSEGSKDPKDSNESEGSEEAEEAKKSSA